MNRRDRSGAPRSLCRAAGPLWREIISKLLQEADACQKMLSVKVRLLQRSLVPPPLRSFLHFLAFVCSPGANHLLFLLPLERLFCDFPPWLIYITRLSLKTLGVD